MIPAGPGADDEDVHRVGQCRRPGNTGTSRGFDPRVGGYVAEVVKLHWFSCPHCSVNETRIRIARDSLTIVLSLHGSRRNAQQ